MRHRPTLADYAVIAITPALIMLMVGSLVFFLIEVFYVGQFDVRLSVIMGLFVMAAVLIGRISIEEGREYASLFAIALGVVTAMATLRFVQFQGPLASISPLVSLGLVGLIWWSADKLTWDCTVIDEQQDASGEGLLQTTGMDGPSKGTAQGVEPEPVDGTTTRELLPARTVWQKFLDYRRRPHAPGVWVLYFSLAALPIFGFGQWFVSQDLGSRRYVFQLLVVYLMSGLGLLLTTSFLGLRRYLRQRRLTMPVEMAGSWFGVGATMIAAVLLVCMLLPRRNPEYSVTHLPFFAGSRELSPSEMGFGSDGPEDDERASQQVNRPDAAHESDGPGQDPGSSDGGQSESSGGSNRKSQQGQQQDKSGQSRNKSDQSAGDRSSGDQQDGRRSAEQQDSGQSSSSDRQDTERQREQQERAPSGDDPSNESQSSEEGSSEDSANDNPGEDGNRSRSSDTRQENPSQRANTSRLMSNLGQGIGGLFKLVYWIVTIVIVTYLLWRYWAQVVAAVRNFRKALQDFWDRLWGRRESLQESAQAESPLLAQSYRPFAEYPNPFLTGMADRYSPQQLVRYSFEAFEAWSRERGVPRDPEQTPHEFASAVSRREKSLAKEASRLAELYCWTAYGRDVLPKASLQHLRSFWIKVSR